MTVSSFAFAHRRPDLSRAQFVAHWSERHAKVVRGVSYLQGYVQNVPARHPAPPGWALAPYDGIAGFTWGDPAAAARPATDPYVASDVVPDERRFLDLERLVMLQTEPRLFAGPGSPSAATWAVKVVLAARRHHHIRGSEFQAHHEEAWHRAARGTDRCVVHSARNVAVADPPSFDAVVECWWADLHAYASWCAGEAGSGSSLADLVDPARSFAVPVHEHVVVGPPALD